MKLEQLEQLIEVDRQKSISKAARVLYIGQSTLSGSMANLEKELSVQLFQRTASGVVPTNEGKEVIQLAKLAMDSITQIQNIGRQEKELDGTVVVTMGQGFSFLTAELLNAFYHKHPKAEMDLHIETPDAVTEALLSGESKLVLGVLTSIELEKLKKKKPGIHYEVLGGCKFRVYVGKKHRLSNQSVVTWEELAQERFVTNSKQLNAILHDKMGIEQGVLTVSDKDALNQLISIGDRVAFLPELFIKKNIYYEHGEITVLDMLDAQDEPVFTSSKLVLMYPDERTLTLLEQSTLHILREILKQL